MGELKGSGLEINESRMQSTRTPDLLGNTMSCKDSLDVFTKNTTNADALCGFPKGDQLLTQLSVPKDTKAPDAVCKAIIERRGDVKCQLDEKGGLFTVDDGHGHYFMNFDGKWSMTTAGIKGCKDVTDLQVNKDGSYSYKDASGKFSYDKQGHLAEAPAGDGHTRKYHYDKDGHIDQIDGRLGHWERQVKDGHVSWVNKDTKAVWQGDFKLNNDGTLEFHANNGIAWGFTTHGKDVRIK